MVGWLQAVEDSEDVLRDTTTAAQESLKQNTEAPKLLSV
jgi:hypothetical protein